MEGGVRKASIKVLTIVASTCAAYEILLNDWSKGSGFAIAWLLIVVAQNRTNNTK